MAPNALGFMLKCTQFKFGSTTIYPAAGTTSLTSERKWSSGTVSSVTSTSRFGTRQHFSNYAQKGWVRSNADGSMERFDGKQWTPLSKKQRRKWNKKNYQRSHWSREQSTAEEPTTPMEPTGTICGPDGHPIAMVEGEEVEENLPVENEHRYSILPLAPQYLHNKFSENGIDAECQYCGNTLHVIVAGNFSLGRYHVECSYCKQRGPSGDDIGEAIDAFAVLQSRTQTLKVLE